MSGSERRKWIDLCGADGMRYALPYRELRSIEMPTPDEITIRFVDGKVLAQGRNLEQVYEDLLTERVLRLQEDDVDWALESDTFISKIAIIKNPEKD